MWHDLARHFNQGELNRKKGMGRERAEAESHPKSAHQSYAAVAQLFNCNTITHFYRPSTRTQFAENLRTGIKICRRDSGQARYVPYAICHIRYIRYKP